MQLKDIRRTIINTDKISFLNDGAVNRDGLTLTLVMDGIKYVFNYLKADDITLDYEAIKAKMLGA